MDKFQIYIPFFTALSLVLIAIKSRFGKEVLLSINKFGFEINITKNIAGRVAFVIGAFTILSYYLCFDYSKYFPSHLEMEVFYDEKGINESLSVFSDDELKSIGAKPYNRKSAYAYYAILDAKLKSILGYQQFFSTVNGIVHSKGETSFIVQKISGIHNYYITESKGELIHVLEVPGKASLRCLSFFEKLSSSNDYIRPNIWQILIKGEVILCPRFKQIIAEKNRSTSVLFDHTLLGLTKVYLIPYPHFSNTVYFFKSKTDGLVPIGYAVYK